MELKGVGLRPASAPGSHTTGSLGLSRFSGWRVGPNALVGSPQSYSLGFPAAGTEVNTVPVDLCSQYNNGAAKCTSPGSIDARVLGEPRSNFVLDCANER